MGCNYTDPQSLKEQDDDPSDRFNTSTLGSRGPFIRDEQTVNVFILALLSAITATTVPFDTRWVAERNTLQFTKNVIYKAKTDGSLRNQKGQSFSLIEVKPRIRGTDLSIRVQETAQIAAWISHNKIRAHDPDKKCEYVPSFPLSSRIGVALPCPLT